MNGIFRHGKKGVIHSKETEEILTTFDKTGKSVNIKTVKSLREI